MLIHNLIDHGVFGPTKKCVTLGVAVGEHAAQSLAAELHEMRVGTGDVADLHTYVADLVQRLKVGQPVSARGLQITILPTEPFILEVFGEEGAVRAKIRYQLVYGAQFGEHYRPLGYSIMEQVTS